MRSNRAELWAPDDDGHRGMASLSAPLFEVKLAPPHANQKDIRAIGIVLQPLDRFLEVGVGVRRIGSWRWGHGLFDRLSPRPI